MINTDEIENFDFEERAAVIEEGDGVSREKAEEKARENLNLSIQELYGEDLPDLEIERLEHNTRLGKIPEGEYSLRGVEIIPDIKSKYKANERKYLAFFYVDEGKYKGSLLFFPFTLRYKDGKLKVGRDCNFRKIVDLVFPDKNPVSFENLIKKFPGTGATANIRTVKTDWKKNEKPRKNQYSVIRKLRKKQNTNRENAELDF